ncbi:site-specific integrase [Salinimonas lutimaris]|uniref:site-specific integrase n=1 Tax=Salinimonas lutimaris TaxID=914153 RepID=UPI0010C0857B|nr:site-specific integrase [Salinimonas lutimaris]
MQTLGLKHHDQLNPEVKSEAPDFWWLGSDSDADIWRFKPDGHSVLSAFTVKWTPNTGRIEKTDLGRWVQWKEYAQKLVIAIMESGLTNVSKPITLASYAREVRSVCMWFYFTHRMHHISEVTREHIEVYEDHIKESECTSNHALTKLNILNMMWKLREHVGSGLAFLPYHNGQLGPKARRLGVRGKRTKTIPPMEFFSLLDQVLKEVEGADEWLYKLEVYLTLKTKHGLNCSWHYTKEFGESTQILFKRIRVIYAAAIVTILSLTAMRKHEATVLKYSDAIKAFNEDSVLIGAEHKTSHTETGKTTKRPLPEEGIRALKVILELTKYQRTKASDPERLLLRLPFQHTVGGDKKASEYVNTRVLYNIFDALTDHISFGYKLRPHMLRRAFAMTWTWRFEIGDLEHLARFLYHNNHVFTEIYVDDPDVYEFLPEEMQRYTARVFEQAFLGDNDIKGGVAPLVSKYIRLIRQKVNVIEPETVRVFVAKLIDKFNYEVIPNADGYCFMSSGRSSRAKCSTDGVNPDYSNRNEEHCSGCPNFGVDAPRVGYWEKRRDAHKAVEITSNDKLMVDASRKGVKRAEHIISMFKEVD